MKDLYGPTWQFWGRLLMLGSRTCPAAANGQRQIHELHLEVMHANMRDIHAWYVFWQQLFMPVCFCLFVYCVSSQACSLQAAQCACLEGSGELVGGVRSLGAVDDIGQAPQHVAVCYGQQVVGHGMRGRVVVMQVAEQVPQREPQLTVHFGGLHGITAMGACRCRQTL